jgi:hypothetical protein
MEKNLKKQTSLILFIVGLVMVILPYLKGLETMFTGISLSFNVMFYVGLLLMIAGYALRG